MSVKLRSKVLLVIACWFAVVGSIYANTLADYRQDFVQAEKYIAKNRDNDYLALAAKLENYILYPYLQYQWLKTNLDRTQAVERFLADHKDTRYALLLRHQWLRQLAQQKQWQTFFDHYQPTSSVHLQCAYHFSRYQLGQRQQALTSAQSLWAVGRSQPKNCDPLFKLLLNSSKLTPELLWRRFELALDNGKTGLANYVKGLMSAADRQSAAVWLSVHNDPRLVSKSTDWHRGVAKKELLFAHAIDRLAARDIDLAVRLWDTQRARYAVPAERQAQTERLLALKLAYLGDARAFARLKNLSQQDSLIGERLIRSALIDQNWDLVERAYQVLEPADQHEIKWQYWLARSQAENGKQAEATDLFSRIAGDRSFYGFLSAKRLNRDIQLNDQPVQVTAQEIQKLALEPRFLMVDELRAIDRLDEAKRQWWYLIRKLDNRQIMTAAKLAQQWHWDQVAIITLARVQYWDDVDLRFPLRYVEQVNKNSRQYDLDPAVVLGIIRRESAFDDKAVSPVGARGLMQIMPRTGQQIARDLKQPWRSTQSLFNPELNIKYGTFYYKQLLDQFSGHYALAAAAYNAGPHRVKRWLPKDKPLAADIWVETIPFKETRAYVAAVLSYALIYQNRMQRNVLKIDDFIQEVLPN